MRSRSFNPAPNNTTAPENESKIFQTSFRVILYRPSQSPDLTAHQPTVRSLSLYQVSHSIGGLAPFIISSSVSDTKKPKARMTEKDELVQRAKLAEQVGWWLREVWDVRAMSVNVQYSASFMWFMQLW